jgi:hypothetical protein
MGFFHVEKINCSDKKSTYKNGKKDHNEHNIVVKVNDSRHRWRSRILERKLSRV